MSRFTLALLLFLCGAVPLHPGNDQAGAIFTDITATGHLNFTHDPLIGGNYFFPEIMGSGCALFDYDKDGDLDIYLISPHKNRLFRQDGNLVFVDVTDGAGLIDVEYGMGVAIADIDNDGDLDLLDTNYGKDKLFRNNGDGTFSDITQRAGIDTNGWSTSAAFFDFDRDGLLDLYIARYVKLDPSVICTDRAGRKDYCGPEGYEAEPDLLYHNRGNGAFEDVSKQSGITRFPMKGLGVTSSDFNNDGYPDLYVANDRQPNHLWINQQNGTFRDAGLALGAAVNAMGQPEASMGVASADYNNDGLPDIFTTNLRDESNTLYRNTGQSGFRDETSASGLGSASLPFTGFGTGFLDYNNDGLLDLAIVNGRVIRGPLLKSQKTPSYWDYYSEPNLLFRNEGNGKFANVSAQSGAFASYIANSRGLAFGDIDNDGDVDLLMTNCGGPAHLFRNDYEGGAHWLLIRAYDPALKRDAVGSRVTVIAQGKRITRFVQPAYSYLSSSDPRLHFGLANTSRLDSIEVVWPDGSEETFTGMNADQILTLQKGKGR